MKKATLSLLLKESKKYYELLLAMKKRGFGKGKWNGVGGKLDRKKGDSNIVEAAVRETLEEINVRLEKVSKVAVLKFQFPFLEEKEREKSDQEVHVFLVKSWWGKPQESEEMKPQWFRTHEIPYEDMWDDDKLWLPHILEGRNIEADFVFDKNEKIQDHSMKFIK